MACALCLSFSSSKLRTYTCVCACVCEYKSKGKQSATTSDATDRQEEESTAGTRKKRTSRGGKGKEYNGGVRWVCLSVDLSSSCSYCFESPFLFPCSAERDELHRLFLFTQVCMSTSYFPHLLSLLFLSVTVRPSMKSWNVE